MLGTVSFPGPSMSAHPVPIIHAKKLDEKYGSKHDWNIRTTAAAYLNDFYTNVYNGLHVSGVNYLAANYNKGTPIRIIGGVLEFPYPVMTRADSGINTIQDLKGKTLGTPKGSYIYAYVVAALKNAGLEPEKDVKLENINIIQAVQLLERGDFDAVLTTPEHSAKLEKEAPGEFKPVSWPDKEVARMLGVDHMLLVFAVHVDWLKENPGKAKAVLDTMRDVQSIIDNDPDGAQAILAPKTKITGGKGSGGANVEETVFNAIYRDGFRGRKMRWYGIPVQDIKAQLKKEFELYKEIGFIKEIPDDGIFHIE